MAMILLHFCRYLQSLHILLHQSLKISLMKSNLYITVSHLAIFPRITVLRYEFAV